MDQLHMKLELLKKGLAEKGDAIVAFSGGVDSTFLLKIAYEVLGQKVLAVTATSSTYPRRELEEAKAFATENGIRHLIIRSEELEIEGFSSNPKNRCYYCKHELFSKLCAIAESESLNHVVDGSNHDDIGDFRPGHKAARELGVTSPLLEAGLSKQEIRELSKEYGLKTWNKPAFACLSSRFPYGNEINHKKLGMVEAAEQFLLDLGFRQVRVRHHGEIARIEVAPEERIRFSDPSVMDKVAKTIGSFGFAYVTLDLSGYRTGSMNEVLSDGEKKLD